MPLTEDQKAIISASVPVLEEHGVTLTSNFYAYMLENHPEVRPFFNKAHQITKSQPKILAFALVAYAKNINDLTPLLGFVRQIVEKHVGLQVQPEHYNIVGSCLLHTLKDMLGDAATPEFMEAWKVAYFDLANILIDLEKARYEEVITTEKGWEGFKPAKVVKLVKENDLVQSVYFKTEDGEFATPFPGQYICIRFKVDGNIQSREYSLSNNLSDKYDYYRISVKKIQGGVVSNFIHNKLAVGDTVEISSPYGKLLEPALKSIKNGDEDHKKPVMMFVAGIGVTPSLSIAEYFAKRGNKVSIFLSFSNLESTVFQKDFQDLSLKYPNVVLYQFLSRLPTTDAITSSTNFKIFNRRPVITDLDLVNESNANDFQYFMIGPLSYMEAMTSFLSQKGVDVAKVNSEQFGPVHV